MMKLAQLADLEAQLRRRASMSALAQDLSAYAKISQLPVVPSLTPYALKTDIPSVAGFITASALTPLALKSEVPQSETLKPKSESKDDAVGSTMQIPSIDHQHPRLSSTSGPHVTDANGKAMVMFTREFPSVVTATFPDGTVPGVDMIALENNTGPVPNFKVMKFLKTDGSDWINAASGPIAGALIYASKARTLPAQTQLSVGTLLTSLNNLRASLNGYAPYEPAVSTKFTCIAIASSAA